MPTTPPTLGTVYVIQQPTPRKPDGWTPDFSQADKYGRLEFIFPVGERTSADPIEALKTAAHALARFDPETDYLLWPSFADNASLYLTFWVAGYFRMPVRVLHWVRDRNDHLSGYYEPITIGDIKSLQRQGL